MVCVVCVLVRVCACVYRACVSVFVMYCVMLYGLFCLFCVRCLCLCVLLSFNVFVRVVYELLSDVV